jgi:hypothetical protein
MRLCLHSRSPAERGVPTAASHAPMERSNHQGGALGRSRPGAGDPTARPRVVGWPKKPGPSGEPKEKRTSARPSGRESHQERERNGSDGDPPGANRRLGSAALAEARARGVPPAKTDRSSLTPWQDLREEECSEIDHILPQSLGGNDALTNLMALHRHCHDQRHAAHAAGGIPVKNPPGEELDEEKVLTSSVRREALCRIPGAARKNLEERSWVNRLTQSRKAAGDQSMPVKRWFV